MSSSKSNGKELCSSGEKCYRKDLKHFETFSHPHLDKLLEEFGEDLNIPTTFIAKISHQTLKEQLKFLQDINYRSNTEDSVEKERNKTTLTGNPKKVFSSPMSSSKSNEKEVCSYGEKCYRKNLKHFETFSHPHLDKLLEEFGEDLNIPTTFIAKISHQTLKEQLKFLQDINYRCCGWVRRTGNHPWKCFP